MAGNSSNKLFNWKMALVALALSLGSLALIFVLAPDGFSWRNLRLLAPEIAAAATGLVVGFWLVEALRIWLILRILGERFSVWRVFQVNMGAAFLSAVTPLGAGGPPAQAYFLSQEGVGPAKSALVVTLRLLFTILFFTIVTPVVLIFYQASVPLSPLVRLLVLVTIAALIIVFAVFFYLLWRPPAVRRTIKTAVMVLRWLRLTRQAGTWPERISRGTADMRDALSLGLGRGLFPLFGVFLLTAAYWALYFSVAPLLLAGFGFPVPYLRALVRLVVLYFLMSYVPLPGGSGVAELGLASLFAGLVPAGILPVLVAWWRFFTYYLTALAGWLFLWRLAQRVVFVPGRLKLD